VVESVKKQDKAIFWLLGLAAATAMVFDFIKLLPLFNAFFIRDDYLFLDLGAFMRQQDPLAFLTATCIGWWRPIALLLPALIYLLFGFNPLPFHITAYIIHLLTALLLILLCRKFFNLRVGLLAFIIYMTSPISFGDVGWMLGAMEDETATFFFFLALFTQLRLQPQEHRGPYYIPALFLVLGSFCKITWLGIIPVLLFMDWVNYPQSSLGQRIIRFLPFLIFIPTLFLNFLFIGFDYLGGSFIPSFTQFFTARNLIFGSFISFIPLDLFTHNNIYNLFLCFVPIIFLALAMLFGNIKRRVAAICVAYLGTLAILGLTQIQNDPVGWIMGWRHLAPLVGFAAVLIALTLGGLMDKLGWGVAGWMLPIALLAALVWSGLPMKKVLRGEVEKEGQDYRQIMRDFKVLCRSLPPKSEVYILAKKPLAVNLLADLAGSDHPLAMLFVKSEGLTLMHNYDYRSKHMILKDKREMAFLIEDLVAENSRFLSTDAKGNWIDITDRGKDEFYLMLRIHH
jgi:hypothetical protein